MLKSKRAELHARIGRVLETDFSDQVANAPELLAYHFTQAGNLVTAIPLWREAGVLALRRVAFQEAVGHFQKGLTLIEQQPPSPERDSLELSFREALNAALIRLRGFAAPEVSVNATSILQLSEKLTRGVTMRVKADHLLTAARPLSSNALWKILEQALSYGGSSGRPTEKWPHRRREGGLCLRGRALPCRAPGTLGRIARLCARDYAGSRQPCRVSRAGGSLYLSRRCRRSALLVCAGAALDEGPVSLGFVY
jgi:hypothetical protein